MECLVRIIAQAARMCWEAQTVMLLRGLRMAQGGAKAEAEMPGNTPTRQSPFLLNAHIVSSAAPMATAAGLACVEPNVTKNASAVSFQLYY
jgi:hypothetical protein